MTNAMQKTLALVAFVCFFVSITTSYAQTSPTQDGIIYIDCSNLTADNYGKLFKEFQNNSQFELGEACVPAKVISVKIKDKSLTGAKAFEAFQSKTSTFGLGSLKHLSDFNDERFMSRCQAARYGRN
jgi:hypothetical protein